MLVLRAVNRRIFQWLMWRREEWKRFSQRDIILVHRFLDRRVTIGDEEQQSIDGVVAGAPSIGEAGVTRSRYVLSRSD